MVFKYKKKQSDEWIIRHEEDMLKTYYLHIQPYGEKFARYGCELKYKIIWYAKGAHEPITQRPPFKNAYHCYVGYEIERDGKIVTEEQAYQFPEEGLHGEIELEHFWCITTIYGKMVDAETEADGEAIAISLDGALKTVREMFGETDHEISI